ncbi:MAG: cupin domain-containing protein [Gemmatimonadales bacterium]
MRTRLAALIGAAGLTAALSSACDKSDTPTAPVGGKPELTPSSGGEPTLLGRATFAGPSGKNLRIKRSDKNWQFEISAKPAFDLAVQDVVFQPGGQSGWRSETGPVFIQVLRGTMTFYSAEDPACSPVVVNAGEGWFSSAQYPHLVRNATNDEAETLFTAFVPPGADIRVDADQPANCPVF